MIRSLKTHVNIVEEIGQFNSLFYSWQRQSVYWLLRFVFSYLHICNIYFSHSSALFTSFMYTFLIFIIFLISLVYCALYWFVWRLRDLNALQIKKTHANRKNMWKLRKLHHHGEVADFNNFTKHQSTARSVTFLGPLETFPLSLSQFASRVCIYMCCDFLQVLPNWWIFFFARVFFLFSCVFLICNAWSSLGHRRFVPDIMCTICRLIMF